MTTAIEPAKTEAALMEQVLLKGDLKDLTPVQRVSYYQRICESLGLNPLTKPFDYITLNGRLTLYAKRDATDQLRRIHGISIQIASREQVGDLFVVTAHAAASTGQRSDGTWGERTDESIGAVSTVGLKGEALANAMMKAETKAKRRVTLSIAGLGWMDEAETGSVPGARVMHVDTDTGEILDAGSTVAAPSTPNGDPVLLDKATLFAKLNDLIPKAGLNAKSINEKAREMTGKAMLSDLTVEELARVVAEVEGLVLSTSGASA